MTKGDRANLQAVERFKEQFLPYKTGYAIRLFRSEPPVLVSEVERDQLAEAYAEDLVVSIRWLMGILLTGIAVMAAIDVYENAEVEAWHIYVLMAIAVLPFFFKKGVLRRRSETLGVNARAIDTEEFADLKSERLKAKEWRSVLLPFLTVPFLAWRMHPHVPPQVADDYANLILLLGLTIVCLWATFRKLQVTPLKL